MTRFLAATLLVALFAMPALAEDKALPKELIDALLAADSFEVLSLDPSPGAAGPGSFEGYKVKKTTQVKAEADRKAIAAGLQKSVAEGDMRAKCFNPRHGIRATFKDQVIVFVICFECSVMTARGPGLEGEVSYEISNAARAALDAALAGAGPPKPKRED